MSDTVRPRRRWLRSVAGGVGVLLVGGILGWAGSIVLIPPADVLDSTTYTYVDVVPGEVGSSINLNVVAEWTPVPVATNQAAGVVTSIVVFPGQTVGQGTVLYTVNLRPVVIAAGAVPAFRSLQSGVAGADVAQLQDMLAGLGLYSGPQDGAFGSSTTRAVKAWQKSLGVARDGVVALGDVVFVPTLPARVSLDDEKLVRGATLAGGEDLVRSLFSEPVFSIPITESQAALLPTGTRVEISAPDGQLWQAFVVAQEKDDGGGLIVTVAGEDGASICGDGCALIDVATPALLPARVVTVETVGGLVVPSAALISDADGALSVIDAEGVEHPVDVVASSRGMAVIEGVEAGLSVRVPAAESAG